MLAWIQSRVWVQRSLLFAAFVGVAMQGYILVFVRVPLFRDFDVHREIGRRFLAHIYFYDTGYFGYPYMPIAAMYFAPLAFFDRGTALALRYTVAVACLGLTLLLWYRMVRDRSKMTPTEDVWIGAITVLLAFPFILQDLDDGGPHLILLAILTTGIYSVWQGREPLGAMWFGLAIAVKVTPALFLPFFLWKRRWRLAGYTALAMMCWIILPLVCMSPGSWWKHQSYWTQVAAGSFMGQETPVTQENEQRVRNQSLRQTLMRYLVTLPEDHPLRREDPRYMPVLNLRLVTAQALVIAVMAGLIGWFGWSARRPYGERRDPAWLRESSAVLILTLLLSPVTWVQHLVWLVPALYLIVANARSNEGLGLPAKLALGVYVVLAIVLNYEFLGRRNFAFVLSYHPYALAMLLVLAILLLDRRASGGGSHILQGHPEHVTLPQA